MFYTKIYAQRFMCTFLLAISPCVLTQQANAQASWVSAWSTPPTDAGGGITLIPRTTFRQTITAYTAGDKIRLRLSNVLGSENIALTNVTLAAQSMSAGAISGSSQSLTFAGKHNVIVPAGGYLLSDPVYYPIKALQRYHISFTPLTQAVAATRHAYAYEMPYVSYTAKPTSESGWGFFSLITPIQQSWVLIDRLEVETNTPRNIVMAVGDSITDGSGSMLGSIFLDPKISNLGTNTRYPDFLARRLAQANMSHLVVQNAGISGNRIGVDAPANNVSSGNSLLTRLNRDVIGMPNLKTVILLEGINDLGIPASPSADKLINDLSVAVRRLKEAGVKVILGTILPAKDVPLYYNLFLGINNGSAAVDVARKKVNAWIRTQQLSDSVVDFDQCLRDPKNPSHMRLEYNSGDYLHPSVLGHQAMAACIDLTSL